MNEFKVGDRVCTWDHPEGGLIYAARPGRVTGKMMYSVKFTDKRENPGHGFYYAEEISRVEEE